jgi:hypothetical protein
VKLRILAKDKNCAAEGSSGTIRTGWFSLKTAGGRIWFFKEIGNAKIKRDSRIKKLKLPT